MSEEERVPSGWDPHRMLASLTDERDVRGEVDEVSTADRIFRENLPMAAQAIVHTAIHSTNDKLRLDAARYVVERSLGGIAHVIPKTSSNDPFTELLADVVSEVEEEHVERAKEALGVGSPPVEEG